MKKLILLTCLIIGNASYAIDDEPQINLMIAKGKTESRFILSFVQGENREVLTGKAVYFFRTYSLISDKSDSPDMSLQMFGSGPLLQISTTELKIYQLECNGENEVVTKCETKVKAGKDL